MKTLLLIAVIALTIGCGVDMKVEAGETEPVRDIDTTRELEDIDLDVDVEKGVIEIEVKDIKSTDGMICFSLFAEDKAELFGRMDIEPSESTLFDCVEISPSKSLIITLNDLPYGDYGLTLFHDENNNTLLDTGKIFGMPVPKEPVGFSNNPSLLKPKAPSFKECSFSHNEQETFVSVKLKKILSL